MTEFQWTEVAERETTFFSQIADRLTDLSAAAKQDDVLAQIHAAVYAAYQKSRPLLDSYTVACLDAEGAEGGFSRCVRVFRVCEMSLDKPSLIFRLELRNQLKAINAKIRQIPKDKVERYAPYVEWLCSIMVSLDEDPKAEMSQKGKPAQKTSILKSLLGLGAAAAVGWIARDKIKHFKFLPLPGRRSA